MWVADWEVDGSISMRSRDEIIKYKKKSVIYTIFYYGLVVEVKDSYR